MSRVDHYCDIDSKRMYSPLVRFPPNKHHMNLGDNCSNKIFKTQVVKTKIENINLTYVRPRRAGVIIYTYYNGSIYFGLGLDSRTHDLTDFGGQISYYSDKNVVNGLIREFEEETLNIFEKILPSDIKQCPVIYDRNNLITFVHLNIDPDTVSKTFNRKYCSFMDTNKHSRKKEPDPEVCGITWLSWEEFQHSIKTIGIFYFRVRKFLAAAGDFSHLL